MPKEKKRKKRSQKKKKMIKGKLIKRKESEKRKKMQKKKYFHDAGMVTQYEPSIDRSIMHVHDAYIYDVCTCDT